MKTGIGNSTTDPAASLGAAATGEQGRPAGGKAAFGRVGTFLGRHRYALGVIVGVAIVAAGQLAEDMADSPPIQMLPPTVLARRWTVVVAVLYMLVISRIVEQTVERSLPDLQRVLKMDDETFLPYRLRLSPPEMRVNLALLGISAIVVAVLFLVLGTDLPTTDDPVTRQPVYLPSGVAGIVVLAAYTLVGWAGLTLINVTQGLGRALGEVSRKPFDIDVFDTTNLLPFGNIALAVSLAPAGVIIVLLLGLGQPNTWLSWTILLLAGAASLLALLLPLRGIHRQMAAAKQAALGALNERIGQAYTEATTPAFVSNAQVSLNERTNTLIPLRKTVQVMTTWPFRDTVAFGRAVLIASAPLIYTALEELIRIFWLTPLSR